MRIVCLPILFGLLLLTSFLVPRSSGTPTCMCGTRSALLVLADFPEYRHLSSRAEITHLFFGQVARYFEDVSYGKLSVVGNATDWITLPKLYQQYVGLNQQVNLVAVATDSFTAASLAFNFTSFDQVFLVLSFYPGLTADYISLPKMIMTRSGALSSFAVVEEDRDWTAYARGYALTLGLWPISAQLQGLGQYDIISGGQGDLSAWSKMNLGWINNSQVLALASPTTGHIVSLGYIEQANAGSYAVRLQIVGGEGFYILEARQSSGYDKNTLPEYGLNILYIPPSNSSVQIKAILGTENVGKSVYSDPTVDLSIVALNETQSNFILFVGNLQDGRNAQRALYAISQASDSIQSAQVENRIEGLDLSEQLLANARALFVEGRFQDAEPLALSATTTADNSGIPADYSSSVQLIGQAEKLKSQASTLNSGQATTLVGQASELLDSAKQAFVGRDFSLAKQRAQAAIDLYNRAQQAEATERILGWLSTLALAIPIVILAFALRYQLKS